ncbi:hypothetical protein NHX12_003815 [Muraenolepis orangiensis]|uniref:Uncharacterized protein n=1 Tax=Muraenolepis orangiensis TaxID=630683 RepID=A0A9Q0IE53_9TELE|nr:hypothetical protein NHX12_003815 [Muraenolepis orangiensis]
MLLDWSDRTSKGERKEREPGGGGGDLLLAPQVLLARERKGGNSSHHLVLVAMETTHAKSYFERSVGDRNRGPGRPRCRRGGREFWWLRGRKQVEVSRGP